MEPQTITITKTQYEELVEAYRWLSCLQAAGVDNWEGHDTAVDIYDEDYGDADA